MALQNGALAWGAVVLVWLIIVSTLRNGISCDEGYYLLGYLRGQSVEGIGTDFHSLVRFLCGAFSDSDIMVFRYTRLFLNIVAIILFMVSSYEWLSRKKGLHVSRWAYYPLVVLAGAMSFTFAAPTLSYDSLEVIIILSAASLLFVLLCTDKKKIAYLSSAGIGFLIWFACSNYPPAGVCIAILLALFYVLEARERSWTPILFAVLGVLSAIVVSHFFVHNMKDWFSEMSKIFVSTFTEKSKSRHDGGSLILTMLYTVGKECLVFVPIVATSAFLYKKVRISDRVSWAITITVCAALIVFREVYELRSTLLLIPVALLLGKVLAQNNQDIKKFLSSKEALLVLIMIAIPVAAVFGTNQPIMKKAIIYAPFWVLAFSYLSTKLEKESIFRLGLILTTVLMAGYIWLGNFQRYHCYYTPRSSRYEIIGASRPQEVLVSQYQQEYYRDLLETLRSSGCKPGDKYMAFGENQMAVYLAGGYIDGRLPYHWWQYRVFEKEAPQAFIFFKSEEEGVISHFKQAGWGFPDDYERIEMRQMSQNMGEELRTVIYIKNHSLNR